MANWSIPFAEIVFDEPKSAMDFALFACFGVAFLLVILLYIRDTRRLNPFWTFWLLTLRMAAFAALVVIAFNPRDRIYNQKTTLSRLVLLVDTSASMDLREKGGGGADATAGSQRTRADAVREMFEKSPVLDVLSEYHNVSIYTFDRELYKQPLLTVGPKSANSAEERANLIAGLKERFNCKAEKKPLEVEVTGNNPDKSPWQRICRPEGDETRLGDALKALMQMKKGQELSAVVLISDGGHNSGVAPKAASLFAKANSIKLFTIGVGSTEPPVNLRLAGISAPTEVNRGDPYDMTVYIHGNRMPGAIVEVDLKYKKLGEADDKLQDVELKNDEGPKSRLVPLPKDGTTLAKTFELKPLPPGSYEYRVKIRAVNKVDEFDQDDNAEVHQLSVIERNLGVLLIAGGPMRDYRFVRNMLFRHKNIDVDVWLQTVDERFVDNISQDADDVLTAFPQDFPIRPYAKEKGIVEDADTREAIKYDAIIAFDPKWDSEKFGPEGLQRMERWLSERAGGLIIVAGEVNTNSLATAGDDPKLSLVRDMYPVVLSQLIGLDTNARSDKARNVLFTPDARGVDFLKISEGEEGEEKADPDAVNAGDRFYPLGWREFYREEQTLGNTSDVVPARGFFQCYPTEGTKAGAVVYARFDDPNLSIKPVLLAAQDYGVGRVLYFGTPEMWRLRDLDVDYYDRFWIKAIRESLKRRLSRGQGFGSISLRKDTYFVGDTVRVEANLLTSSNKPVMVERVPMIVIRPNGKALPEQIPLLRDSNRKGFYAGDFTVRERGTYRLHVANPGLESNKPVTSRVRVKFSPKEKQNPIQDAALLTSLATGTGGQYLTLEKFAGIFKDVHEAKDRLQSLESENATASDVEAAGEKHTAAVKAMAELFEDKGYTEATSPDPNELWDTRLMLFIIVTLLSIEWMTRKLLKLA